MRLPRILHNDQVTIISVTAGPPDDDGEPTETRTETPWRGVNVQQMTSKDLADAGRDTRVTTWRVAGPPAVVDGGDLIRWRGTTYHVDGRPDTRTGLHRLEQTTLFMVLGEG